MNGSTGTIIRPARSGDARAIGDVFLAARAEALPHIHPPLSEGEIRAYLSGLIENPSCALWVAERKAELLGFLALREAWVDHLYVRPDWYRHGIGTLLLEQAKRVRPRGLRLFCFQCNHRACAFYQAQGMASVRAPGGPGNPEGEPDLEFRWTGSAGENRSPA